MIKSKKAASIEKLLERKKRTQLTMEQVAEKLSEEYRVLDRPARNGFMRTALTMYANYENKWSGQVNLITGEFVEDRVSAVDVNFTVPMLTAAVDTHTTFYTKARPRYIAKPRLRGNTAVSKLAKMCQEIAQGELDKMLTSSVLQRESQYMALATVSYRILTPSITANSPVVEHPEETEQEVMTASATCDTCGYEEKVAADTEPDEDDGSEDSCPHCLGTMQMGQPEVEARKIVSITKTVLPRLKISVPNPIYIQSDFNAADFTEALFCVKRKRVPKHVAEYSYQIDLSGANTGAGSPETQVSEKKEREALALSGAYLPADIGSTGISNTEKVDEIEIWAEPAEYGLFFVDGAPLMQKFPTGLYMKIVGDVLVTYRPAVRNEEIIRVQHGLRPGANTGMGLVHVADMNELINNEISLEYSILMTYGFPLQLLRGKYLKELPAALQTFVVNNIPDTMDLGSLIHREQPANTSGMLGILSQRVEGYMRDIGGTWSGGGGVTPQMREMMGTATGASAIQEMMSDRMGLSVQRRVEADIQTLQAILRFIQKDKRNRQWLLDAGYDDNVVDHFFAEDLTRLFDFEVVKGTDEPQLDSVNTFKVQSFASLVAPLTGLRQFDPAMFYDIVAEVGKSLNIPMGVGAGRKERNLAESRIDDVIEVYKTQKDDPEYSGLDPAQFGEALFRAVMMNERLMIDSVVAAQMAQVTAKPVSATDQQAVDMTTQLLASKVEAYLYDYDALQESYSDWLQSDAGQSSALPIQIAVGLLFTYALDMRDKRKAMDFSRTQAMAASAMGEGGAPSGEPPSDVNGNSPTTKRDGTTGPGRPRDVSMPETPEEYS